MADHKEWRGAFRRTWKINPVTQVTPSDKTYNRSKEKAEVEAEIEEMEDFEQGDGG